MGRGVIQAPLFVYPTSDYGPRLCKLTVRHVFEEPALAVAPRVEAEPVHQQVAGHRRPVGVLRPPVGPSRARVRL